MSLETDVTGMMFAVKANISEQKQKEENAGNDYDKLEHKLQVRYWSGYLNALEDIKALIRKG
jgi:hypothetical protein